MQTKLVPHSKLLDAAVLDPFKHEMRAVANLLGDVSKSLPSASEHRLLVEARYSEAWKAAKDSRGTDSPEVESTKQLLRAEGLEQHFVAAVDRIARAPLPDTPERLAATLKRFAIALRYAVHLSADKGDRVCEQFTDSAYDLARPWPLPFVHAYQAFLVKQFQGAESTAEPRGASSKSVAT